MLYSIDKEIYAPGEAVQVTASQGVDPIIYFYVKNLKGTNAMASHYSPGAKAPEILLDPFVQPGEYEIVTLQPSFTVLYSKGDFYQTNQEKMTTIKVLRFKVENNQRIDNVAPVIGPVTLQKTSVKIGEEIVGSFTANDDLSGLDPEISLIRITGKMSIGFGARPSINQNIWTFSVKTKELAPGTYVLQTIQVTDKAGNIATIEPKIEFIVAP